MSKGESDYCDKGIGGGRGAGVGRQRGKLCHQARCASWVRCTRRKCRFHGRRGRHARPPALFTHTPPTVAAPRVVTISTLHFVSYDSPHALIGALCAVHARHPTRALSGLMIALAHFTVRIVAFLATSSWQQTNRSHILSRQIRHLRESREKSSQIYP